MILGVLVFSKNGKNPSTADAVPYGMLRYRGLRGAEGARFTPRLGYSHRYAVLCGIISTINN